MKCGSHANMKHTQFECSINLVVVRDTSIAPFMVLIAKDGIGVGHKVRQAHDRRESRNNWKWNSYFQMKMTGRYLCPVDDTFLPPI
jgi:hypothetical protein